MGSEHINPHGGQTSPEYDLARIAECAVYPFSQEETSILSDNIQRSEGKVTVFVHPFYALLDRSNLDASEVQYLQNLRGEVSTALERGTALLFLEENHRISYLSTMLDIPEKGVLFVVPTNEGGAVPYWVDQQIEQNPKANFDELFDQGYADISKSLRDAGALHLTIGGTYLNFMDAFALHSDREEREFEELRNALSTKPHGKGFIDHALYPEGCVGQAVVAFANNGFDITVSTTSSPANTFCPRG